MILVIGDPHFMKHNSYETDQLFSEIENIYNKHGKLYTVVLGDVLNDFGSIPLLAQCRAIKFLEMCHSHSTHLFILVGNHDRINQKVFCNEYSSLRALKLWSHTTVVDSPIDYTIENTKILLVPYVEPGRFYEALGNYNIYEYDIVFSHQEYGGIKLDNGPISESKDIYPEDGPLCFNGHIHTYSKNKNLINVGTPYNKDFGDTHDDKAVILLNLDGTFQRIFLDIRKKRTLKVKFEDLDTVDLNSNYLTRLIIFGDSSIIVKSTLYKKIKALPYVEVRIENVRETANKEPFRKINFLDYLHKKLSGKKNLISLFNKILSE